VLPSIFTVTPFGIAVGFFPIRDMFSSQPSAISSQLETVGAFTDG
jgi:hypothetical protein